MQKTARSLKSYLSVKIALDSDSTRRSAKFALDIFSNFLREFHQSTPDKIVYECEDKEMACDLLQGFVNWYSAQKTQQGDRPSERTVKQVFHNIKRYFRYMGIKISQEDVSDEIKLPKVHKKSRHGVTKEEIIKICENTSFRKKCMYLAQISSGMRIGELCQIRKKHLDLTQERIMVRIPSEFTKTRRERITFFSKEFDKLFRFKINEMSDDDLLFVNNPRVRGAVDNEIQNMQYVCKKTGLKNITTHSFRAYFITKVARLDHNLSQLFTGQEGYLLQYDRPSEAEMLQKYIEFEPELLIFEAKPESEELQKIRKELEEYKIKVNVTEDHFRAVAIDIIKNLKPDELKRVMASTQE